MIKCKNTCPEGKFDGCCSVCPFNEECEGKCTENPQGCNDAVFEGEALEVFQNQAAAVIQKITLLVKQKKEIEEQEAEMRKQLQTAMEKNGIKAFDNEVIKVTYVEPTSRTTIDSTKLKAQQPDIYAKFSKTSAVKAFVKIEVKDDGKGKMAKS
jgi:predicted phage-related endonuclease